MSKSEMKKLGWDELDVLLVTGDAYVDHPSFGIAIIGRLLTSKGYRTGIISQPDWKNPESLKTMGTPRIACAVSSGNIDSMLCIYTAGRRMRKEDAYSPGGITGLRPPHAVVVYSQLARQAFGSVPVIIGGVEASMRRFAHYDYWQDKIRPGILADSKADILVYGMGEKAILEILGRLSSGKDMSSIRGTVRFPGKKASESFLSDCGASIELPTYEDVTKSPDALMDQTKIIESEMNPFSAKCLFQRHNDRVMIQESPCIPLNTEDLDKIYSLPFTGLPHPSYKEKIPAYEMIKNSITSLRGCPGACSFCGISLHQGKFVTSRSRESILCEIRRLAGRKDFRGTVSDMGGPTANTYGHRQSGGEICEKCKRVSCLFPEICRHYNVDQHALMNLLEEAARIPGVEHLFISSGLRLDLAMRQKAQSAKIIRNNVSGHLKVAPEHLDDDVLALMRKNPSKDFLEFIDLFREETEKSGKKQFVTPYFISNFPGSTDESTKKIESFLHKHRWELQQVQDFIPLPLTMAAAMYYCGKSCDGNKIHVNKGLKERRPQIKALKKGIPN